MKKVAIYTDGACSNNPGPGGYCAILQYLSDKTGEIIKEEVIVGAVQDTTNNRMEITAVLCGLEALKESCEVDIYSDSAYVCNAFLLGWLDFWPQNNWLNSSNKKILNKDLWLKMVRLRGMHTITIHKVKAHSDNFLNNRCDTLARREIMRIIRLKKEKETKRRTTLEIEFPQENTGV